MAEWVEWRAKGNTALVLDGYASTPERKAFLQYASGRIELKPEGTYRIWPLRAWGLEALGFVWLLPKTVSLSRISAMSIDNVQLSVDAAVTLQPRTTDEALLRRIILSESEEEGHALRVVSAAIRSAIALQHVESVRVATSGIDAEVLRRSREAMSSSPFELTGVVIDSIDIPDSLADSLARPVRQRAELAELEHDIRKAEVASRLVKVETMTEAERNKVLAEVELGIATKKAALASSEPGAMVLYPEQYWRTMIERVRAVGRDERMLVQLQKAVLSDQWNLVVQILGQQHGVALRSQVLTDRTVDADVDTADDTDTSGPTTQDANATDGRDAGQTASGETPQH